MSLPGLEVPKVSSFLPKSGVLEQKMSRSRSVYLYASLKTFFCYPPLFPHYLLDVQDQDLQNLDFKYESDVMFRDDDCCSEFFGGFLKPLFKLPENTFGTADQVFLS